MSSKKKKKQSMSMEDHGSLRYRDGKAKKDDFFDRVDYEISSVLLELSHPLVFSSDSPPLFHKWGRTRKRSSSVHVHPPVISPEPVIKSVPSMEVGDMGSNSSSSCLTGEAKKTNPQTIKKVLEEEFCTKNQSSSQPNTTCSVLEAEMGLLRAQAGLVAQPIRVDQNLRHLLQPLISVDPKVNVRDVEMRMDNLERRGFDLNLPASEYGNRIAAMVGFQRVAASKVQAAAQARQRRLGLIRSKKLHSSRFISSNQYK